VRRFALACQAAPAGDKPSVNFSSILFRHFFAVLIWN
jgi:hypothetical protein